MSCLAGLVFVVAIAAQGSAGAPSGPTEMTWTDIGDRSSNSITFTAAPPLCPSGTVRDVGGITGIKMEHTCADGSGTFEFEVIGTGHFHFSPAGTGRYTTLRGTGSCSVTQNDDGTFTRSCHALADFDNVAPSARITNLDVLIAGRTYRFGATFKTRDNVEGNIVSYRLSVAAAGRSLGHVTGTTRGGSVTVSLKVKMPKHAKRETVSLKVADPLHNSRTVTRSARVPH